MRVRLPGGPVTGRSPGLTPDMPGVVLALAFRTRQTQGVEWPRACGLAARLQYAGNVLAKPVLISTVCDRHSA